MQLTQALFDAAFVSVEVEYLADCERVVRVGKERFGISMTLHQAEVIWDWRSDNACASWLMTDAYSDDEIADAIESFVSRHRDSEPKELEDF